VDLVFDQLLFISCQDIPVLVKIDMQKTGVRRLSARFLINVDPPSIIVESQMTCARKEVGVSDIQQCDYALI
jgi:hypothetical protein